MEEDKIQEGLICVLTCVEPCLAFDVRGNKENKKLVLMKMGKGYRILGASLTMKKKVLPMNMKKVA